MRVLVADDAAVLRVALAGILSGDHEIVAEATDAPQALGFAAALQPEVMLVDSRLPPAGALEVVPGLRAAAPASAIFIIAALGEVALVRAAVHAGARGALRRPLLASEVREALAELARTRPA